MTNRAERRHRTELVIIRRENISKQHGQSLAEQKLVGHRLHKNDPVGHCGNKGCRFCALEREMKRLAKKRVRHEGKMGARAGVEPA